MRAKTGWMLLLCAVGACAKAKPSPASSSLFGKANGQLRVGAPKVTPRLSADATFSGPICATFTLTPFSINASGGRNVAGQPYSFDTGGAAAADAILGCIDPGNASIDPNWGYYVVATHFNDCSGNPIDGLSPQTVAAQATVECAQGADTPLDISVNVSIAAPNQGGYVDIGASVDATDVQIGCKQADGSENGGPLHFGESYFAAPGATLPAAYTAIGVSAPGQAQSGPASGTLQLFPGVVNNSSVVDETVAGLLQLPPAPQLSTVVQSFEPAAACPAGQMTVQPVSPTCITTAVSGSAASTHAVLADLFTVWPGLGAVTATVSGSSVALYTSLGGPSFSTVNPDQAGSDALSTVQTISTAPDAAVGIYASLVRQGQLLLLIQTAGGPAVITLVMDPSTGVWTATAPAPLSGSLADQQAEGLFVSGGCYPMPPLVTEQTCAPESGAARGWADALGLPARIPVGTAAAGATWSCRVARAGQPFSGSPAPCDGADGSTPFLAIQPIADGAVAASAPAYANDGAYQYEVTESVNGSAGAPVVQTVYMHHDLNGLCGCQPEATAQELFDFVAASVPDCGDGSSGTIPDGPCLAHGGEFQFDTARTQVAPPFIKLGFKANADGSNPDASFLSWVIGTPLWDHGYSRNSYLKRTTYPASPAAPVNDAPYTHVSCSANGTIYSLRHLFSEDASGQLVASQRVYPQRLGAPIGSCQNIHRTGVKTGAPGSLAWSGGVVTDQNGSGWSYPYRALRAENPETSVYDPGSMSDIFTDEPATADIDCSAGEVFDAVGNQICVKRDATSGALYVARYTHEYMCRTATHAHAGFETSKTRMSYSPKTTKANQADHVFLFLPN